MIRLNLIAGRSIHRSNTNVSARDIEIPTPVNTTTAGRYGKNSRRFRNREQTTVNNNGNYTR